MIDMDFPAYSEITRKKIKTALEDHYRSIEKTTDPDILETSLQRLIVDMHDATEPLDTDQAFALGKVMEGGAFLVYTGATLETLKDWTYGQLENFVFEGHNPENVD